MEQKEIIHNGNRIVDLLKASRVSEAIVLLAQAVEQAGKWELKQLLQEIATTYDYMLTYVSKGVADPERTQLLRSVTERLYVLNDKALLALLENISYDIFYARRRELTAVSIHSAIEDYCRARNKYNLLLTVDEPQRDKNAVLLTLGECERAETTVFNKIWSTWPMKEDEAGEIKSLLLSDTCPGHARGLFASALLLSLMKCYDETKLALLMELYCLSADTALQVRCITAVMVSFDQYPHRVENSDGLKKRFDAMAENISFARDVTMVQRLLVRSRNTDNVSRRVTEELMPGIIKTRPDILKKLKNENMPADIADLEANPDWQQWLDDSGIAKKMEELNELHASGSDVFIATFSHLKNFPFFQTLSNWFLPYHGDHTLVLNTLPDSQKALRGMVAGAPFMCNSDKFSLCLSLDRVPQAQRDLMVSQLDAHHAQMKETHDMELPGEQRQREPSANVYIQDLYRFFKLFSRRREFCAVFDSKMDFFRAPLLSTYLKHQENITFIAEFYLKNGFYDDAIAAYDLLLSINSEVNPIVFQKIGFAHQCLGNLKQAVKWYKRYELANDADAWTIRHLAACYRQSGRFDKAIDYYARAHELAPQNVAGVLNLGHVYLEAGQYDDALQCYLQADFMPTAKHRAWRPVAWCSFLLGNFERSITYYKKIMGDDSPTPQDFLNMGHAYLCDGHTRSAIERYAASLDALGGDVAKFNEMYYADVQHLVNHGMNQDDIALSHDAALRNVNNQTSTPI